MNPEDVVLIGAIKRKKDLQIALEEHWYRIPFGNAPKGVYADYLAFFLGGHVAKDREGPGVYYYAERRGMELVRRRDLLPGEGDHKNADKIYHKIQLGPLEEKSPPILNAPNPYRFSFIYTTWDRFSKARHIRDLYHDDDYFVDRVYHVLRQKGYKPLRRWSAAFQKAEFTYPRPAAQVRVLCENGSEVVGSTGQDAEAEDAEMVYLRPGEYLNDTEAREEAERIIQAVERHGGPRMIDIPVELY